MNLLSGSVRSRDISVLHAKFGVGTMRVTEIASERAAATFKVSRRKLNVVIHASANSPAALAPPLICDGNYLCGV